VRHGEDYKVVVPDAVIPARVGAGSVLRSRRTVVAGARPVSVQKMAQAVFAVFGRLLWVLIKNSE
jgi:hypothetical protein